MRYMPIIFTFSRGVGVRVVDLSQSIFPPILLCLGQRCALGFAQAQPVWPAHNQAQCGQILEMEILDG